MSEQERAHQALKKIEEILNGVRDIFGNNLKPIRIKKSSTQDSVRKLERVQGIIKNFNEENSDRKLRSLITFLRHK